MKIENLNLDPPNAHGDPLLRQLNDEGNYQVLNLKPPEKLTNILEKIQSKPIKTVSFPQEEKQELLIVDYWQSGPWYNLKVKLPSIQLVTWNQHPIGYLSW